MKIELHEITKRFCGRDIETAALDGVSLSIPSGKITCITGPSGCGKTSLLSVAGLLERPDSGEVRFDGRPVSQLSVRQQFEFRRVAISFVFQSLNLIEELTVHDNVILPGFYLNRRDRNNKARADRALEELGLTYRADHLPRQLSGGQRQRVAIARALANRTDILLADEPTGNLDSESSQRVMQSFEACRNRGVTVVIVTHSPEIAAIGDQVVELQGGKIANIDASASQAQQAAQPSLTPQVVQ